MAIPGPAEGMKDCGIEWVGEIPCEWKISPLKFVLSCYGRIGFRGYTTADLVDIGEGPITLSPTNIINNKLSLKKCSYISWDKYYESPEIMLHSGDIVFVKTASVGKCAIYDSEEEATVNPQFVVLKDIKCDRRFLFYTLISPVIQIPVMFSVFGSVVGTITQKQLLSYRICLPTLLEQQAIADYLDERCSKIDEIISEATASIEEYKGLKQAVITDTVTKGLNKQIPLKNSGYDYIGDIPVHWSMCKVRHIGHPQNGISFGSDSYGEGYPFVSYGDVYRNYSLPEQVEGLIQSSDADRERYSVQKGDIFFTRTSETKEEIGFSCVCTKTIPNAVFAGFLIRVRPFNKKLDTGFAKYYFRSNHLRAYFVKEMNLVIRASLGQELLKGAPVLLPPIDEQKEIAVYLDKKCSLIDSIIDEKEAMIQELQAYKKSLIYEVVTGKRRVV